MRSLSVALAILLATPALAQEPAPPPEAAPPETDVSAAFPYDKRYVEILGSRMAYVDEGEGPVVLFLHGNPTSSYLWRNIIPHVADNHRAIAVDLIGMGDSDQPDIDYRFATHAAYLDAFIAALALEDIALVIHDWGSGLGLRYARLNEDNVRAIAFMEAIIPPLFPVPSYESMGPLGDAFFRPLRTDGTGEDMVLENNFFIEQGLTGGIVRELSTQEMNAYRGPYTTPGSRLPTLVWPRQIPIGGEPADVVAEIQANGEWLYSSDTPKLYFHVTPGAINPPPVAEYVIANAPNLEAVFLGQGSHFIQEDHPRAIGEALSDWLDGLE